MPECQPDSMSVLNQIEAQRLFSCDTNGGFGVPVRAACVVHLDLLWLVAFLSTLVSIVLLQFSTFSSICSRYVLSSIIMLIFMLCTSQKLSFELSIFSIVRQ